MKIILFQIHVANFGAKQYKSEQNPFVPVLHTRVVHNESEYTCICQSLPRLRGSFSISHDTTFTSELNSTVNGFYIKTLYVCIYNNVRESVILLAFIGI